MEKTTRLNRGISDLVTDNECDLSHLFNVGDQYQILNRLTAIEQKFDLLVELVSEYLQDGGCQIVR